MAIQFCIGTSKSRETDFLLAFKRARRKVLQSPAAGGTFCGRCCLTFPSKGLNRPASLVNVKRYEPGQPALITIRTRMQLKAHHRLALTTFHPRIRPKLSDERRLLSSQRRVFTDLIISINN